MKRIFLLIGFAILGFGVLVADMFNLPRIPVSAQKLMPAGWWGYEALTTLAAEDGKVFFFQNAPLSVEEIKSYLNQIDIDKLSENGQSLYYKILDDFKRTGFAFNSDVVACYAGINLQPEFYYKSNADIDWSFSYFYKGKLANAPLSVDLLDKLALEIDLSFGKNYWAQKEAKNFCNIPLDDNDFEFVFFDNAYFSVGHQFTPKTGFGLQFAQKGLSIGNAQTGSIIYSELYETDFYAKAHFYSPKFRYELITTQQEVNTYVYLHHFEVKPFKWIQAGFVEGNLINAPFELRFLNPFLICHQFQPGGNFVEYNKEFRENGDFQYYPSSRCSAYWAYTIDITPCKYLHLYLLYAQNEYQGISERVDAGLTYPDSLGYQFGMNLNIPSKKGGYWTSALEGYYATPWLYIKPDPRWSMFRARDDNLNGSAQGKGPILSWIGNQYGPDTIYGLAKFGYNSQKKWRAEMSYMFVAKGENSFNLFYKDGSFEPANYDSEKDEYTYYPYAGWQAKTITYEEAVEIARNKKSPTGIPEYSNIIALEGEYHFTSWISLYARASYVLVLNCKHKAGNTQQGAELALSTKITFLK